MLQNSFKLKSTVQRVLLIVPAIVLLLGGIIGFCLFFGNSIAINAQQPDEARTAIQLSPSDPFVRGRFAFLKSQSFVPTDLPEALIEYERAAALSPNDYRYWLALGRTREKSGDAAGAELAARRAVELAPNYTTARWLLGNVLLRRDQSDAGFAEMRRAAEADPSYAVYFINTVIQVLNTDDIAALQPVVGDSPVIQQALVGVYLQSKKYDQALAIWQNLPTANKQEVAHVLKTELLNQKKYRADAIVYQYLIDSEADKPRVGKFQNSSFETDVATDANTTPFAWQIGAGAQPQIGLNQQQKRNGERSLLVIFNSITGQDFRNLSQLIAVDSSTAYRLETFAKTADWKTQKTVQWEVVNAVNGQVLATTAPVAGDSRDWQRLTAEFKTDAAMEAIVVRMAKVPCASQPCSVIGRVWFDEFNLQKTQ